MNKEEHKTNTHYCILEVHETATQEQIKAAYSTMFKRWHPDLNSLKKGSECTICMQHINKAYSVLQDPNSRAQYDNLLRSIRSSEATRAQSFQTYNSRPGNPKGSTGNGTYARDPNPSPAPAPQPTGFTAIAKDIGIVSWQLFKLVFKASCTIVKYTFFISFFFILIPLMFSGNGYDDRERRY